MNFIFMSGVYFCQPIASSLSRLMCAPILAEPFPQVLIIAFYLEQILPKGINRDHLLSILFSLISSSSRAGCSLLELKNKGHQSLSLPCYIGCLTVNHCDFECFGGCLLVGAATCWKFQHPFVTQGAYFSLGLHLLLIPLIGQF